jgi:pseudouridine synthase
MNDDNYNGSRPPFNRDRENFGNREGANYNRGGYGNQSGFDRENFGNREGANYNRSTSYGNRSGYNRENFGNREGGNYSNRSGYGGQSNYNQGGYNRGYGDQGGYNRGGQGGGYNRGYGDQGGYNRGGQGGGYNRGYGDQGGYNRGYGDQGGYNRGGQGGGYNRGYGDQGGYNDGSQRPYQSRNFDNRGGQGGGYNRGGQGGGYNRGGQGGGYNRGGQGGGYNRGGQGGNRFGRGGTRRTYSRPDGRTFRHRNRRREAPQYRPPSKPKKSSRNYVSLPRMLAIQRFACRKIAIDFVHNSRVKVNNTIITDSNHRVHHRHDFVKVDNLLLKRDRPNLYIMMYKPGNMPASKESGVRSVHSSVPDSESWYFPAGRLTKAATGLTILTNDASLKHPENSPLAMQEKEYHIKVHRTPTKTELTAMTKALAKLDAKGTSAKMELMRQNKRHCWISVVSTRPSLHDICKILKGAGLEPLALHRHRIGKLTVGALTPGAWKLMSSYDIALVFGRDTEGTSMFYQMPEGETDESSLAAIEKAIDGEAATELVREAASSEDMDW